MVIKLKNRNINILLGIFIITMFLISKNSYAYQNSVNKSTYIDDTGITKTIYWVDGIVPPKMGGVDSQFKKEETIINGTHYIEYTTPFINGNGWYDVNKNFNEDTFLCYSAAASNMLHWWFDKNSEYITKYISKNPNGDKIEMIKKFKNSGFSQYNSTIYQEFVKQFANRKTGYWADILQDQFINGYFPKENGGVNDPDWDGPTLIENGPVKNGGYFYDVFGINKLTERRYYDSYIYLSKDIKSFIYDGKIITLTYDIGPSAHVVTIWGVEYDPTGNLSAVYYTDSDDSSNRGMSRYRIVNRNGIPYLTTDINDYGVGSRITSITTLSTGKNMWDKYYNEDKKEIIDSNVFLEYTNVLYDGKKKIPKVNINNLKENIDYKVKYENNLNVGVGKVIVTGIGSYMGEVIKYFNINPINLDSKNISISYNSIKYDGKEKRPKVVIDGLIENTDYKVIYKNNIDIGVGSVVITGIGNYKGEIIKKFEIFKDNSSSKPDENIPNIDIPNIPNEDSNIDNNIDKPSDNEINIDKPNNQGENKPNSGEDLEKPNSKDEVIPDDIPNDLEKDEEKNNNYILWVILSLFLGSGVLGVVYYIKRKK